MLPFCLDASAQIPSLTQPALLWPNVIAPDPVHPASFTPRCSHGGHGPRGAGYGGSSGGDRRVRGQDGNCTSKIEGMVYLNFYLMQLLLTGL